MKRIAFLLPLAPRWLRDWHARRVMARIAAIMEYREILQK